VVQGLLKLSELVAKDEINDAEDCAAGLALQDAAWMIANNDLGFNERRPFAVWAAGRHGVSLWGAQRTRPSRRLHDRMA
jgi:hypothetical protein